MTSIKYMIFTAFFLLSLTACVSSSRHQAAQSELEQAQKQLAIQKAINSDLQKRLGETSVQNTQLEISSSEMQQALDELAQRKMEAERRIARFKSLSQRFQSLVDAGELEIKMVDGRMILALPSDVLFSSGSATLSEKGHRSIVKMAQLLADIQDRRFQVEGHTDNVPIRTARFPSNWELAASRATTVVKTMVEAGFPKERISAASYADVNPILSNDNEDDRKLNRRIEIAIVPDLSLLPGHEELKKISEK